MPLAMTPTLGAKIVTSAMTSQSWWINSDDWTGLYVNAGDPARNGVLPTGGLPNMMWHVYQNPATGAPGINVIPVYAREGTSEAPASILAGVTKGINLNGWFTVTPAQAVPFGAPWTFHAHIPGASHIGIIIFTNVVGDAAQNSLIHLTLAASAT